MAESTKVNHSARGAVWKSKKWKLVVQKDELLHNYVVVVASDQGCLTIHPNVHLSPCRQILSEVQKAS